MEGEIFALGKKPCALICRTRQLVPFSCFCAGNNLAVSASHLNQNAENNDGVTKSSNNDLETLR